MPVCASMRDMSRQARRFWRFGGKRAAGAKSAVMVLNLSETGDLREAAANLFSHLHKLDKCGARNIAVEPVAFGSLGDAINDRLSRAAAPRGKTDKSTGKALK